MFSELQVQVQIRRVPCKTFYGEWPSMGSEYNRCPVLLQDSTSGSSSPEEDDEESLISEPDMGSDPLESRRTWLVEQCLAWGGEQRLRLRLTLAFFPGHSPSGPTITHRPYYRLVAHSSHGNRTRDLSIARLAK